MPPKTRPSEPSSVRSQEDRLDRLSAVIERLADEVHVLREALDELREQYEWALRNREQPPVVSPFVPLTSLSLDPLAEDFRINRVRPEDLPPEESAPPVQSTAELF